MIDFLKQLFQFFIPPDRWRFPVIILLGIFIGIGCFIFYVSNASSYISDDPKTCVNCHVMFPQYASWQHSSHFRVTNCNDCHVPHTNAFRKYAFKANDGLRHATIFTLRNEPQVIQIRQAGIDVVQENCIRCHVDLVDMVSAVEVTGENSINGKQKRCWDCHRETPHGTVNSLASAPNALIPQLSPIVPDWVRRLVVKKPKEKTKINTIEN